MKTEVRIANSEFRIQKFFILNSLFAILIFAFPAFANELTVDKHSLLPDDSLTITLTLQGAFAGLDVTTLPLRNLVLDGPPSQSSEFQWINGQSSRRKVLRWTAHPRGAGEAIVGPLVLQAPDGQRETLAAIAVQVIARPELTSNDPVAVLREMLAIGRDPLFVVADVDRTSALAGEEVIVTWTLYNATTVQQWALGDMPKLGDFWVEETDVHDEQPRQIILDGVPVQRLVIRRAALFPLHGGRLTIPPLSINAAVLQRRGRSDDFLGVFEGVVTEVRRQSPALTIDVRPLAAPVDVVGDVTLRCDAPVQRNGGPVVVALTMSGRANLRTVPAPRMAGAIDGSVQIVDRGVTVDRMNATVRMTRRWEYLIFPSHAGSFAIPPIVSRGVPHDLRCEPRTIQVSAAVPEPPPPVALTHMRPIAGFRRAVPWLAGVALVALIALLTWPAMAKSRRRKRETRIATESGVESWLTRRGIDPVALAQEASDRGEAYRALRSITDAIERDRIPASDAELEIERRTADLVGTIVG